MQANKFIELDPSNYLVFQRPFNNIKTCILNIKNVTDSTVVFKVKTTAPSNYIVVPNCGNVGVNEIRTIEIKRNISSEEFPPNFKCKDKFLVQSMKMNDGDIAPYTQKESDPKELQSFLMAKFQEIDHLKKSNPTDAKALLSEIKLAVIYQPPVEELNSTEAKDRQAPLEVPLSGKERVLSANANVPKVVVTSTSSTELPTVKAAGSSNLKTEVKANAIPQSTATAATDATYNDLAQARAKIEELQKALRGYRQDQAALTSEKTSLLSKGKSPVSSNAMAMKVKKENTIPVEIVAIVAILAFLIGAFCF